jgi:serine phosphatase RsbU (regulator of sigma subunit)
MFTDSALEECRLSLEAVKALVFLSDGVVEARNAAAELVGFERSRRRILAGILLCSRWRASPELVRASEMPLY